MRYMQTYYAIGYLKSFNTTLRLNFLGILIFLCLEPALFYFLYIQFYEKLDGKIVLNF